MTLRLKDQKSKPDLAEHHPYQSIDSQGEQSRVDGRVSELKRVTFSGLCYMTPIIGPALQRYIRYAKLIAFRPVTLASRRREVRYGRTNDGMNDERKRHGAADSEAHE